MSNVRGSGFGDPQQPHPKIQCDTQNSVLKYLPNINGLVREIRFKAPTQTLTIQFDKIIISISM